MLKVRELIPDHLPNFIHRAYRLWRHNEMTKAKIFGIELVLPHKLPEDNLFLQSLSRLLDFAKDGGHDNIKIQEDLHRIKLLYWRDPWDYRDVSNVQWSKWTKTGVGLIVAAAEGRSRLEQGSLLTRVQATSLLGISGASFNTLLKQNGVATTRMGSQLLYSAPAISLLMEAWNTSPEDI